MPLTDKINFAVELLSSNKWFTDGILLFVLEAKWSDGVFDHIQQLIAELYVCAVKAKQDCMRGALTNRAIWVFVIVSVTWSVDREGKNLEPLSASWQQSDPVTTTVGEPQQQLDAETIARILAYWVSDNRSA
jgi:hypothetical protein